MSIYILFVLVFFFVFGHEQERVDTDVATLSKDFEDIESIKRLSGFRAVYLTDEVTFSRVNVEFQPSPDNPFELCPPQQTSLK
jgi:hypothetical protein